MAVVYAEFANDQKEEENAQAFIDVLDAWMKNVSSNTRTAKAV